MTEGDHGATLHAEFNKHAAHYRAKYTNPVTSGQIQDALRDEQPIVKEDATGNSTE